MFLSLLPLCVCVRVRVYVCVCVERGRGPEAPLFFYNKYLRVLSNLGHLNNEPDFPRIVGQFFSCADTMA